MYLKNFGLLYFWIPDSGFRIPAFRVAPRDIPRRRQLHGLSGGNALDSECKLLLARAGKAPVFLYIISKIISHMHLLEFG